MIKLVNYLVIGSLKKLVRKIGECISTWIWTWIWKFNQFEKLCRIINKLWNRLVNVSIHEAVYKFAL